MQTMLRWGLLFVGYWPLPLLHALGVVAGLLLWWLPNGLRAVTLRHMELCLPRFTPEQRRRIARRSLIESMKALAEAPAIWFGPDWRLQRWLGSAEEKRALRSTIASANGIILLTPHLGAWELTCQFAAQFGPMTLLYKPQKGALDALIQQGRTRNPNARPMPTSTRGVKALLAALGRGETVGLLPDHDPPEGSGRFAPLFGIPAHSMDLVGKLSARTGAPVWFVLAERRSWARGFRFHLIRAPDGIADAGSSAAALNQGVEACVMRLPEQYWWSYQRYRRRPPGAKSLYR